MRRIGGTVEDPFAAIAKNFAAMYEEKLELLKDF